MQSLAAFQLHLPSCTRTHPFHHRAGLPIHSSPAIAFNYISTHPLSTHLCFAPEATPIRSLFASAFHAPSPFPSPDTRNPAWHHGMSCARPVALARCWSWPAQPRSSTLIHVSTAVRHGPELGEVPEDLRRRGGGGEEDHALDRRVGCPCPTPRPVLHRPS